MDLWITIAQGVPDATELADGDAQKVLAYVVAALVMATLGLFALLLKQQSLQRAEIKDLGLAHVVRTDALEAKNDKLQERLLRYVANINTMLGGPAPAAPADPLDIGGTP